MGLISRLFGVGESSASESKNTFIIAEHAALTEAVHIVRRCNSGRELAEYLCHYSGYVREATIIQCVEISSPDVLLPLARRLNDWVPEVRKAARSAMLSLLASVPPESFLPALPTLFALRYATRADHAEWLELFEKAFIDKAGSAPIIEGIRNRDPFLARPCFMLACRYGLADVRELVDLGLRSKDVVIAAQVVPLCEKLIGDEKRIKLIDATQCSFGPVRTAALRALLELGDDSNKRKVALDFLCDKQENIRDVAMQWMGQTGFDLRSYYLSLLKDADADTEKARISLLALSKCGESSDVETAKKFTSALSPAVRSAALLCWMKLDSGSKDAVTALAMADESPRVRKLAVYLTHRLGAYIAFDRVRELIESRRDDKLALRLSMDEKWNWLECIVRIGAVRRDDSEFRNMLAEHLERWVRDEGKSYSSPSSEQIKILSDNDNLETLRMLSERLWPEIEVRLKRYFPI